MRQDVCQGGLSEPWGTTEQDVVQGFPSLARRLDEDAQIVQMLGLPDEFVERLGSEQTVEALVLIPGIGCDDALRRGFSVAVAFLDWAHAGRL